MQGGHLEKTEAGYRKNSDFNCTIRRMKHHIGSAVIDQEELLGYLQDHGMTLLNTWHAKPA